MNPLNTIKGSIAAGVIVAVAIALLIGSGWNEFSLARWIHYLAGVMWIGLLYYFNVVQVPGLAEAAADKGDPAAPAFRNTSLRARYSGSVGRQWSLG